MRGLALYARSRHVPLALVLSLGLTVLLWSLWSIFSNSPDAGAPMVVLTVLILVTTVAITFAGPDEALERTAALPWWPRRAAHVLAALVLILVLLLATLPTGARFGPAALVLRDAAGLLGLAALGAATIGAIRAWFAPLGWTLAVIVFPAGDTTAGQIITWQTQEPGNRAAAVTAAVLAVAGLMAYALSGPVRPTPAEVAL
ncbi:hypothetical protein [Nucisporomicrobium flavum]|uniref:hypothetical protein n=1 Tax=Nucisporomicrobium flavum TaxID=2785915 RepID=UPI0018F7842B|nr:hypothetical protein [Nucisporomicrobium flavum]